MREAPAEAGKKIGVSHSTVSYTLSGKWKPGPKMLKYFRLKR